MSILSSFFKKNPVAQTNVTKEKEKDLTKIVQADPKILISITGENLPTASLRLAVGAFLTCWHRKGSWEKISAEELEEVIRIYAFFKGHLKLIIRNACEQLCSEGIISRRIIDGNDYYFWTDKFTDIIRGPKVVIIEERQNYHY